MTEKNKNLRNLSFVFLLIAMLFSSYALFFQDIKSVSQKKSVFFESLNPEQEAWIMSSLFIACLGIGCFVSSFKKN